MSDLDPQRLESLVAGMTRDQQRLCKCRDRFAVVEVEAGDEAQIDSDCRQVYFDA
jgi:hypothetical protein